MATLPTTATELKTITAMRSWWENKLDRLSRRLGASQIGRECERELWYSFRWCGTGAKFDGRMKRLFNRGHREEAVFIEELRGIGCDVRSHDPSTGEQFEFRAVGGHFVAKIDGVVLRVPDAPKAWHVVSFKTANAKTSAALAKQGVQAAKPENWAQSQIEMKLANLDRTLYLSVCKDDDAVYGERIRLDAAAADRLEAKAQRVITAPEPLPRLSEDAAHFKCRFCSFKAACHSDALPAPSCRTCLHATPSMDGADGDWTCALAAPDAGPIPLDFQQRGCERHLYVPALLSRWGAVEDASESEGWVQYRAADGLLFRNGPWGMGSYTSKELHAATPALIRNDEFLAIRQRYAGQITAEAA